MADPQHPAVPFEQAVDLLTGEPRQLRPQHPDIAALVTIGEEADEHFCEHYPHMAVKHFRAMSAALRTLARPVADEDDGVAALTERLTKLWESGQAMFGGEHVASAVRDAANGIPILAREKASAEQEAARLREALVAAVGPEVQRKAKEARERGEERVPCFLSVEWIDEVRALAAAAGAG